MNIRPIAALAAAILLAGHAPSYGGAPQKATTTADWPSYNGSLTSERFSPLDQIDVNNVGNLKRLCAYDTVETTSFETGPIVIGGVAYITTDSTTFAIDATTCRLKWRRTVDYPAPSAMRGQRGAAYADGRIFRGNGNGHVYALDAATGEMLWDTAIGDPRRGETAPAAPITWNGLVFTGTAGGGMYGVSGTATALDARTGKPVWRFRLVPGIGEGPPEVEKSWQAPGVPRGGAGSWTSFTLDPRSGRLYIPTGNPSPIFTAPLRPGDNLYANSIVVLDAMTGRYIDHKQLIPNDTHDWDVSATPALITTARGAELTVAGIKDGHVYAIDRASNAIRYRTAVTHVENADQPIVAAGTRFCPGVRGGVEWNGPAFSPKLNSIFVGSVDWCTTVSVAAADEVMKSAKIGRPWTGEPAGGPIYGVQDREWGGFLTAIDADTGAIRWQHRMPTPMVGATLVTAGGIVLTGDLDGTIQAWDAASGAELWHHAGADPVGGGIVTYTVGQRQYVAVAAGSRAMLWPTGKGDTAKLLLFSLPS